MLKFVCFNFFFIYKKKKTRDRSYKLLKCKVEILFLKRKSIAKVILEYAYLYIWMYVCIFMYFTYQNMIYILTTCITMFKYKTFFFISLLLVCSKFVPKETKWHSRLVLTVIWLYWNTSRSILFFPVFWKFTENRTNLKEIFFC